MESGDTIELPEDMTGYAFLSRTGKEIAQRTHKSTQNSKQSDGSGRHVECGIIPSFENVHY